MAEQWMKMRPRLKELAKLLDQCAFVSQKNLLHLDFKRAREASDLAFRLRKLARRTMTQPMFGESTVAQFKPLFSEYFRLRQEATKVMGDWKPKT